MGKLSRDKGLRRERAIVEIHTKCGIRAERVPLSGAAHYQGNGADIDIYPPGRDAPPYRAEVKARGDGSGFRTLERWLGNNDVLFLWRDRQPPLVVTHLHVWLDILRHLGGSAAPAPANDTFAEADADRDRTRRRHAAEQGPLPPTDAVAEHAA
jgi:hypothetical protein